MIILNISDYTAPYLGLNGTNIPFNFSSFDIARAYMTVGYPKLISAVSKFGIRRFGELILRARNYITLQNDYYELNSLYKSLDPSEQKMISYFYGQSFTKLYAEKYLNCTFVDNINNHKGIINFNRSPKTFTSKKVLYNCNKNPQEPDLLGIQLNNQTHILEAKAYSSGFNQNAFQHAINQVSTIDKVNGIAPLTKTACFFDMSGNPIVGRIIDPDNDVNKIDMEYDFNDFKNSYYANFNLKNLGRSSYWVIEEGKTQFAGFKSSWEYDLRTFFGIERNIFDQLNSNSEINLKATYEDDIPRFENDGYSLGPDGVILIRPKNNLLKKFEINTF